MYIQAKLFSQLAVTLNVTTENQYRENIEKQNGIRKFLILTIVI